MFKKITAMVMTLGLALSFSAMAELHPDLKKDKYGYVDDSGNVVIKHQFTTARPFENGRALVQKGEKWGCIREDGSFIIPAKYDFIGSYNDQGFCWVAVGKSLKEAKKGLYRNEKLIIKPEPTSFGFFIKTDARDFSDGYPFNFSGEGPNEMTAIGSKLSSYGDIPYMWVFSKNANLIYDLEGNKMTPKLYGNLGAPKFGRSMVAFNFKESTMNCNYWVLDAKKPKALLKLSYAYPQSTPPTPFENGMAIAKVGDNEYAIIRGNGDKVVGGFQGIAYVNPETKEPKFIAVKDNKCGIIDRVGTALVPFNYKVISKSAMVNGTPIMAAQTLSDKWGYINDKGEQIVPFTYEAVSEFRQGHGCVKTTNGWGMIDSNFSMIIKPQWESIQSLHGEDATHTMVKDATTGKWYAHSLETDQHTHATGYDEAGAFDAQGRAFVMSDSIYGAVRPDGSIVLPIAFATYPIAIEALKYIDEQGKESMNMTDAYRFNLYQNPIKNLQLTAPVPTALWDF